MENYPLYDVKYANDFRELLDNFGAEVMLRQKEDGGVRDYGRDDFRRIAYGLGSAFEEMGLLEGKVAVIGETSVKWLAAYFAAVCGAGVIVPVDKELPDDEIANVVNDSGARAFVYSPSYRQVIQGIEASLPGVEYFICMEGGGEDEKHPGFDALVEKGNGLGYDKYLAREIDIDKMSSLLYTSGTTGRSKGVMLSQRNIMDGGVGIPQYVKRGEVCMSVLPIHHSYEFTVGIVGSLMNNTTICINDSLRYFMPNLKLFRPDIMYIVPAFAEMIYARLRARLKADGAEEGLDALIAAGDSEAAYDMVKDELGGRLRVMISGGAPLPVHYIEKFREIGIDIVQGYGITECSPLVSVNRDRYYADGSIGLPIPCNDVKIENKDEDGNGEIWVKGTNVMLGYYNNPEATAGVMQDGWFDTGDIGYIDGDGFIFITGRAKNLIVLSNGKNVFPEEIEGYLQRVPYIREVVVYAPVEAGAGEVKLEAEIFVDEGFRAEHDGEDVMRMLEDDIGGVNKTLPVYKQVHEFHLRDREFEKTTKKTIKRFMMKK